MYSEVVDNKRREVANRRAQIMSNWWRYAAERDGNNKMLTSVNTRRVT